MALSKLLTRIKEAYELYLSGNKERPEPYTFSAYSEADSPKTRQQKHWVRNFSIAGIVLVILSVWMGQPHMKPTVSVVAEKAAQTCPTGVPQITVTDVQLLPDPDLDPPSALYMVTGTIMNSTTGTLSVNGIGFYFGQVNPLRPPDWSDSMGNMDVSADPTQILPGEIIKWRDKQVEILDQPAGTDVSAALSYPENIDSNTGFQWSWPDADPNCPSPNIFN